MNEFWGGVKNCAIITQQLIYTKHFKRDRHVDVCEIHFLCFGGMNIVKLNHIYCIEIC